MRAIARAAMIPAVGALMMLAFVGASPVLAGERPAPNRVGALTADAPPQSPAIESRLDGRLSRPAIDRIRACADSASREGLPADALIQRALEGATRRAPEAKIVTAVQNLLVRLRLARLALGPKADAPELSAGATALQARLAVESLRELKAARPDEALTVPLIVLADLMARGVPGPAATSALLSMTRSGADDRRLLEYRDRVDRDIQSGRSPEAAASGAAPPVDGKERRPGRAGSPP